MQLADLAVGDQVAVPVDNPVLDAGEHRPHGLVRGRPVLPHAREARRALGDPVAVEQRNAELVLHAALQREIERRTRHAHHPHSATRKARDVFHGLVFEQTLIRRGHAVQRGDAVPGDGFGQRRGIGFRHDMQRRTMHQGRDQQDRIADDVRHRQHAIDPVGGTGVAQQAGGFRGDQQVAMAQHHPLRTRPWCPTCTSAPRPGARRLSRRARARVSSFNGPTPMPPNGPTARMAAPARAA